MPLVASLIKITALSLALLCVDMKSIKTPPEMASDPASWRSKCRIYFGCVPSARLAARTEHSSRIPIAPARVTGWLHRFYESRGANTWNSYAAVGEKAQWVPASGVSGRDDRQARLHALPKNQVGDRARSFSGCGMRGKRLG